MGGYKNVQDYFLDYFLELPNFLIRVCVSKLEEYLNGLLPHFPVLPSICDKGSALVWMEFKRVDLRIIMLKGGEKSRDEKCSLEWVVFLLKPISFDMKVRMTKFYLNNLHSHPDRRIKNISTNTVLKKVHTNSNPHLIALLQALPYCSFYVVLSKITQ